MFIRRYVKVVPFVNGTRAKEVPFLWNLIQGPQGGAYLNKKLLSGLFDPTSTATEKLGQIVIDVVGLKNSL